MHKIKNVIDAVNAWVMQLACKLGAWNQAAVTRLKSDSGQTVAEYALVLLVVAAIAVAFLVWARQSGKLDGFFDLIFDKLVNSVDAEATPAP